MAKSIEIEASTVDEATKQGLEELQVDIDDVEVEVLKEGGLFSKAKVRLTVNCVAERVEVFVNTLLEKMGIDATCKAEKLEDKISVKITGKDSAKVIGYRGEALDAIQYLAVIEANKNSEKDYVKVVVDAENYREKRNVTLSSLAKKLAYKAYKTSKKVELEPMNPFERRIIHTALQNNQYVETVSEGEGIDRHVVIVPKKKTDDNVSLDILGASNSNFKKNGPKKMRSFGYSRSRF